MKRWSKEETDRLRTIFSTSTKEELLKVFYGRTYTSVWKKAYSIGLKSNIEVQFKNRSNARKREHKQKKFSQTGHIMIYKPKHHRADKYGWVFEHIVIWEEFNKIEIPTGYVVHHINEIKTDNRIENLTIMPRGEHIAYHNSKRKYSEKTRAIMSKKTKERLANPKNHPFYKDIDCKKIEEYVKNGLTVEDACKKFNIVKSTYYKHKKREKEKKINE